MGPRLPLNLLDEIFSSNFEAKTQHEWAILLVCDNNYLGKEEFRITDCFFSSKFLLLKPQKGGPSVDGEPFTQAAWLAERGGKLHTSERYLI